MSVGFWTENENARFVQAIRADRCVGGMVSGCVCVCVSVYICREKDWCGWGRCVCVCLYIYIL